MLSKSDSEVYDLPERSGFHKLNGKYCFVTKEYCEENNYLEATDSRKDFFAPLYYLDKLVSDRVCSNFDDYESCIIQNHNKYSDIAIS